MRLTNWNAQELASLVQVGVPVNFLEKPGTVLVDGDAATAPTTDGIAALLGADPAGIR